MPDEAMAGLLARVASVPVPTPSAAETEALISRLGSVGLVHPTRRATWPLELADVLAAARAQLLVFPAGFWLASAAAMLVGVALIGLGLDPSCSLVLYLVGPLLAYVGMHGAFQGTSLGVDELELACPISPRQLTLARLVVMLAYQVACATVLSAPLALSGGSGLLGLTLSWLAPFLLASGLMLLLSLRLPIAQAATGVYAAWVVVVLAGWRLHGPDVSVGVPLEVAMAIGGLIMMATAAALFAPPALRRSQANLFTTTSVGGS
jgi:hypothetical protein